MIKPRIEDLLKKADSKFALVMGVARRTRQITDFLNAMGKGELIEEEGLAPPMGEVVKETPFHVAMNELAEGKFTIEHVSEEARKARAEMIPSALSLKERGIKEEPEFIPEVKVEEKAGETEEKVEEAAKVEKAAEAGKIAKPEKTKKPTEEGKKKAKKAEKIEKIEKAAKGEKASKKATKETKKEKTNKKAKKEK